MKVLATARARRRRLGGIALVLAVVLAGSVASVGISVAVQRGQQRLATEAMNGYFDDVGEAISDEVDHYVDALANVAAAIGTHPDLTAADFKGMTAALGPRRQPGATAVGWVVPAYDHQVKAVQATWRARGADGLSLYPTGTDMEHKYLIFGVSFTPVPVSTGRDVANVSETADALRIARATGAFAMSGAHLFQRDRGLPMAEQQMSFTLAMPVFVPGTRQLRGWITMGVHGGDFLILTLRNEAHGAIQVRLSDPAAGNTVIASVADGARLNSPGLHRSRTLLVGQHNWTLDMWPTTGLLSTYDRWGGKLIMIGGLAITLLLAMLVALLAGGRNRAMDKVDQVVTALRKDIERREEVERELQRLAFHDQLTGLANRSLFYDRVGQALRTHARADQSFAVFFIDLDGFKQVNDELGHRAGDIVLCEVAERLRACLRDSDTVARFGGDEFAVIAERLAAAEDVHITAGRIVEAVQRPINVGNDREATVTASVGVALNRVGESADDILREADVAMYTAKTTGKSRHVLAGT